MTLWSALWLLDARAAAPLLTLEDQRADLAQMRRELVALHPGLHLYADGVVLDLRGNGGGRTLSMLDQVALFATAPFDPYRSGV